jgi:diguanylate cyclase (GGDEF)-like protein/hemerythrin-like metal-binding protein
MQPLAWLTLMVVGAGFSWLGWRFSFVSKQAVRLRTTAQAIKEGDTLARAQLSRGPLASLGESFDEMAEHVHQKIASLMAACSELEYMVQTDRLTGVGNRRAFDKALAVEVSRTNRYGIPVSVIMLDIDHFKRINDNFGHAIGDQVLVDLTRRVAARLRDTDSIFRWGGEEFAVITPCTPISGAEVVAEALRQSVAEAPFDTVGRVTISLGLAQLLPNEKAAQWVARADRFLYEAKRQGRNAVCFSADADDRSAPFILVWGDQFLTHHGQIDAEHSEIFRLANELILLHPLSSADETLKRLDAVVEHLVSHFAHEEALLATLGAPEAPKHAQLHRGLLAQVNELRRRLENGEVDAFDVGDFVVRRVAIGHLVGCDLPLFASLLPSAVLPAAESSSEVPRASLRMRLKRAIGK